jgi:hypothetical protein
VKLKKCFDMPVPIRLSGPPRGSIACDIQRPHSGAINAAGEGVHTNGIRFAPMNRGLTGIFFHKSGKPRGWLRKLLLQRDKTPRSIFKRIVLKKSGCVRPRFVGWTKLGEVVSDSADPQDAAFSPVEETVAAEVSFADTAVANVLEGPTSLEETARNYRHGASPKQALDAGALETAIETRQIGRGKFIICLGHDDYTSVLGGLQNCIRREEKSFNALSVDYLNLHPFEPLPRLAHLDEDPDPFVNLVLNGSSLGVCSMSVTTAVIRRLAAKHNTFGFIVHQLLGFNPEQVRELMSASLASKILFWLHDYFLLCPSYTLQRNRLAFCNAPPVDSNACGICLFGEERPLHLARLKTLFETVDIDVVSPSEFTLSFWRARTDFPAHATFVSPHATMEWTECVSPPPDDSSEFITVGYLGFQVPQKGWQVFERIAKAFETDASYRFITLSAYAPSDGKIAWSEALTTREDENAMIDAVARERVDLVIHWPSCPETFSFTTYEALAGGAYIVTNSISGNIATTVKETGRGVVLDDEASLLAFFSEGGAKRLVEEARIRRRELSVTMKPGSMSASYFSSSLLSTGG